MSPKVSIIVPVYNTYEKIETCLESLVNQTLDDIEILLINDGSTDNSQDIIDKYVSICSGKVKGFLKENGGLSDARNYGIDKASGEYLAFVDSDDYVDIDCFEMMYDKAKQSDADVVSSPITYSYEDHESKKYYNKRRFGKNVREDGYILRKSNSMAWNKLFRTAFWKKNGFKFPIQWYEDSALIYNVMLAANKVSCVNIPFYHYIRDRDGSIVNTVDERIFDIFKSTDSIISYFKEAGAFEELYETVEYICVRHIIGRVDLLSKNKPSALGERFIKQAEKYLDEHFVDWRKSEFLSSRENDRLARRVYRFCRRHLYFYSLSKFFHNKSSFEENFNKLRYSKRVVTAKFKKLGRNHKSKEERIEENQQKKRLRIQRYGIWMIHDILTMLERENVISFADFGTCLGIVREGTLLKHDLDIDIGVIADATEQKMIRVKMERLGYKLWRQYINDGYVVEESYKLKGVKVDLNYYMVNNEHARTWLFYRKPELEYKDNTRHIVEMTYSPITAVKKTIVDGVSINIPENAEQLLVEKYGSNWRTPDKGWIYWESPAARKLENKGYYITCNYQKIKKSTRELPIPALVRNEADGRINWDLAYKCADEGYDPIVIGSEEDKEQNRHPRIRVYVGDPKDTELIEKIRRRTCGDEKLMFYPK